VSASGSATRSGARNSSPSTAASAALRANWAPDVWGRLRQAVGGAQASAQASEADLASARLSAVGELATHYFSLREADAELQLLAVTLDGYQRSLEIARNRYNAGIAPRTDLLQAQALYVNTQAERVALKRTRDTLEHAIAVLVGAAPAEFSLPAADWKPIVPGIPTGVPSTLLQRRPDIAAAERRAAQANEQIGVAQAAYFPSLRLSGSGGSNAASVGDLFKASSLVWSLGLSLAETIFDGGARRAQVESARAALEQASARYRQTVLAAFQNVEDDLVAARVLQAQLALRQQAAEAANLVEQQVSNRYKSGLVSYTEVVTAQATALNARRSLVQAQSDRNVAAVALIQALGGGWQGL